MTYKYDQIYIRIVSITVMFNINFKLTVKNNFYVQLFYFSKAWKIPKCRLSKQSKNFNVYKIINI